MFCKRIASVAGVVGLGRNGRELQMLLSSLQGARVLARNPSVQLKLWYVTVSVP